ncbi:MAG: transaldolase [Campylobacterales bacterium]
MVREDIAFSIWADFIERDFLETGFQELIQAGVVNGATSNPAIFKQAFTTSKAYQTQRAEMAGFKPKEIYEALAIRDIQRACDLLLPLYQAHDEGFVSLEVDPELCDNTIGTITEAIRLWHTIARPNAMIKIPATNAGFEAMKILAQEGINVNATLVFSPEQAKRVMEAFSYGAGNFRGVVSVFVSRFDRKVDAKLPESLRAKLGIINAAKIYNLIETYDNLRVKCLFASTGVKGGGLPESYYIDELVAPLSINTAPVETIEAWCKNGSKEAKLPLENEVIESYFAAIAPYVEIEALYVQLLEEGLSAFKVAFAELIDHLK